MFLNLRALLVALVFFTCVLSNIWVSVEAALLANRSVTIGNSVSSAITSYFFEFDIQTVDNLGSIEFEFCSNSPLIGQPCTPPSGFNASGAVLVAQNGETGFIVDPISTSNRIVLSRPISLSSAIQISYDFTNITNTSDIGPSYVRVATYATADATGSRTDTGGLAYSINRQLTTSAFVPPYLTFCVGVNVAGDCSSASGEFLGFGELVTNQPKFLTSQFAGATNDPGGYSTFVSGLTMTSGTNSIPALAIPTTSIPGVSQFGMNLRANTNPAVGNDPSGIGSSTVNGNFNQINNFMFSNMVVTSTGNSTDFNLFTASYIVNVSNSQPAGVYNTTLTYIATAAF